MTPEQLYQHLESLAEALGITVRQESLSGPELSAASGLCTVKGRRYYLIEKDLSLAQKAMLLGRCLAIMDLEGVYMLPAVRTFLETLGEIPDSEFRIPN